jgi:hypothetical protein
MVLLWPGAHKGRTSGGAFGLIPGLLVASVHRVHPRTRLVGKTVAVSNTSRAGLAVAGLSLGTSLNPLNSSMIAVALVVLREDFRLDVATVT